MCIHVYVVVILLFSLQCGQAFSSDDVVVLNGDDADFLRMKARMEERRLKAKLTKKNRKKAAAVETATNEPKAKVARNGETKRKEKTVTETSSSKHKSKTAAEKTRTIQRDPDTSDTYKSLFTSSSEAKKQGQQHSGWVSFNPQYFR